MTPLNHYLEDGANNQARAVMAMLQGFNIEESWNAERHCYGAEPMIARWQNCREQGYVLSLRTRGDMLHIAFFEHRNSDSLCAIRWTQHTTNSPTIETADMEGQCYADKYDVSRQAGYGQIVEMAEWIKEELRTFWISQQKDAESKKIPS